MMETGLFCQVNTTKDQNNPTSVEQKHTPVITVDGPVKSGEHINVTVHMTLNMAI
jgi:desulfoferrodoxin (superoxide reductase-like protein)